MMQGPEYHYLQSRIQARHGGRLSDAHWRRLAGIGLLGSYLQGIRRTPLEPWVRRLSERSSHHGIELSLRTQWRQYAAALAGWPLAGWAPAVAWVGRLWDLPVALELCRGGTVGAWARDDPIYSQWRSPEGVRTEAISGHLSAAIVTACLSGGKPATVWCDEWRGLWPETGDRVRAGLEKLIGAAESQLDAMALAPDLRSSPNLRAQFEARLIRLFRGYAATPVAIFAHLGLVALELERLRAALVQRALYPAEPAS